MKGRVCLVIGANRGLGKATAAPLAKLGAAVALGLEKYAERLARN